MDDTLTVPDNPALVAASAEHRAIATDAANPRHAAYQRGDAQVIADLAGLYQRAFPTSAPQVRDESSPSTPGEGFSLTTDVTGQDRMERARADALTSLRQQFGDDFTPNLIAEDSAAIQASLQQEWGQEFEDRWAGVINVGSQLLHRQPQLFMKAALLLGDARGLRLLDAIRQTLADYRR